MRILIRILKRGIAALHKHVHQNIPLVIKRGSRHSSVNYSFNWRVENMILVYGTLEIEWVNLNKKPEG